VELVTARRGTIQMREPHDSKYQTLSLFILILGLVWVCP
jgi:hypothetical protein